MNFHQLTLIAFFLLVAFFSASTSASSSGCEIKGHKFAKDEKYAPIGECLQYTCNGNGAISAKGCPLVQTLKPCKFTASDTTKAYPDCCPKHDC